MGKLTVRRFVECTNDFWRRQHPFCVYTKSIFVEIDFMFGYRRRYTYGFLKSWLVPVGGKLGLCVLMKISSRRGKTIQK